MMRAERFMALWLVLVACGPVWALDTNDPNLVSYWKFDEGSGTTALDTVGDNNGVVHGASWTTGQTGDALSFNGIDDYAEVPDDPSLRFTQHDSFSISLWAMPLSDGRLVCKMRASNCWAGIFGYELYWSGPKSAFGFTAEESCHCYVAFNTPDNSAPAGNWYHVVGVYDNKGMKIYLNGKLAGAGTFTCDAGSTSPDKNLTIGARSLDSIMEKSFGGAIDEVAIYNRALSVQEIQKAYYEGFGAYERAVVVIEDVLVEKQETLEANLRTLEKEWLAHESLEQLLESGNYGDLNRRSIVIAKQDIHFAIQQEQQSREFLERSIERLLDSLAGLGVEAEPNQTSE
jgi:hypothetical protein